MEFKKIDDEQLENVNGGVQITYVVASGENAQKLAEKFKCSVDDICKWNQIADPKQIIAGQELKIKF